MIRILVYPNITFNSRGKNIEQDSYVQVIKKQISMLNEIRDDLWFYLVLPKRVESLEFKNTTQFLYSLPTYPPTMRSHFNVDKFKSLLGHDLDFDLVYSHLPEQTHAIKNTMFNLTHHTPNVFGYCHWFDLKNVVAWYSDSFKQNITGLLECDRVYLNTQDQKDMVLKQASDHFNKKTIKQLDEILHVHHLGVDKKDIVSRINAKTEKIIVFNHRPHAYKNFKNFISICDALYKQRQDFKVWVPLLEGKSIRDYITNERGDKKFYYDKLKTCRVGFSPKQTYGGWSVATTDGLMNGTPYIMFDDTYYKELQSDADFFKSDKDAIALLNKYLDDNNYRNKKAREAISHCKKELLYSNNIKELSNYIDHLVLKLPKIVGSHLNEDTDVLSEFFRHIRNAGKRKSPVGFTKEELFKTRKWGRGMKWTQYRNRLLSHGAIYDVKEETPMYVFSPDKSAKYKDDKEYETWLELIRKQDKKDKKTISKLLNKRVKHK